MYNFCFRETGAGSAKFLTLTKKTKTQAYVSAGCYLLFLHQGVRGRQHSFITRIAPGPECHAPSTTCGTWPEVPEFEYTA